MKKFILSLILACSALAAQAMSYERAREEARFLTDKMAYELNLNDQQYNDCYEINLDYLLNLTTEDDLVYGSYLTYRNADLRHILFDWQWTLFAAADYFLNPVSWIRGAWYFPVYRYYRVGYFYYDHPHVFWSYRGGHGRYYYSTGYYHSRRPLHWNGGFRGRDHGPVGHHRGSYNPGRGSYDRRHGGMAGRGTDHRHNGGYSIGRSSSDHSRNGSSMGRSDHNRSGSTSFGRSDHSRSSYTIGEPSRSTSVNRGTVSGSTNFGSRSMGTHSSGRSSYQHESSTRTTVHSGSSSFGSRSSSGRSSSFGSSSSRSSSFGGGASRSSSFGSSAPRSSSFGGATRSSGMSHSSGMSRGGGSHGGGSHGGGRGGR